MALDSKNNIKSVFIIPNQLTTTFAKMFPGQNPGAVAVCNMSNDVLDATTVLAYDKIKIIKDRGEGMPLQQLVLTLPSIATYSGAAGQAATEQVSFLGNNGSTGQIGPATSFASNFFIVKLEHTPNSFIYGKRPASYKYGTYQSVTGDTEVTVCENLVRSLVTNFRANRTTDWRVRSEVVCDVVTSTAVSFANITLTRYSKSAIVDTAGTVNPGDVIRIADPSALLSNQTAVYKVLSVSGTRITFNYAYQGPSGVTLAAECEDITANYDTSFAGIKITGIKQKYDVNRWRQYDKVRFNVLLEGFSVDTPVDTTGAFDGVAVYEQVANDEYISWGDEGQVFVDQVPPLFREQDAVVGQQYIPLTVGWLDRLPSLIGAGENKGQAILYFVNTATPANQGFEVIEVLNSWLTGRFPGATFNALPA
jgi:hypothetical protein